MLIDHHAALRKPSSTALNPELGGTAASEAAKLALFAYYTTPNTSLDFILAAQYTLTYMLSLPRQRAASRTTPSACNTSSLPQSLPGISLTPQRVIPDQQLLLLLLRCSAEHPQCLDNSIVIISSLVIIWRNNLEMWIAPCGRVCILLVLRFCSHHLCFSIWRQRYARQQIKLQGRPLCADGFVLTQWQVIELETLLIFAIETFITKAVTGEWVIALTFYDIIVAAECLDEMGERFCEFMYGDSCTCQ